MLASAPVPGDRGEDEDAVVAARKQRQDGLRPVGAPGAPSSGGGLEVNPALTRRGTCKKLGTFLVQLFESGLPDKTCSGM